MPWSKSSLHIQEQKRHCWLRSCPGECVRSWEMGFGCDEGSATKVRDWEWRLEAKSDEAKESMTSFELSLAANQGPQSPVVTKEDLDALVARVKTAQQKFVSFSQKRVDHIFRSAALPRLIPIYNLMEDAATAEIYRAQLWQWIHYGAKLDDGRAITLSLCEAELLSIVQEIGEVMGATKFREGKFRRAVEILREFSEGEFHELLTTTAYRDLD